MAELGGTRIALLEARMSGELEALVRRHGGEPHGVAALHEQPRECTAEVAEFVDALADRDIVVFVTAVGAKALLLEAEKSGRLERLREKLQRATTVCRGPKPISALKAAGIDVNVRVREPYTTTELIEALGALDLTERTVCLTHYGERNAPLVDALLARGARVRELLLYEWQLPLDQEPLRELIRQLIDQRFDAIAFTAQVQVRNLMAVADSMGLGEKLISELAAHTVVCAIGPTCAAALEGYGLKAAVMPPHPHMGAMVTALARFLSDRRADGPQPSPTA